LTKNPASVADFAFPAAPAYSASILRGNLKYSIPLANLKQRFRKLLMAALYNASLGSDAVDPPEKKTSQSGGFIFSEFHLIFLSLL
jgi:hypothetical protein